MTGPATRLLITFGLAVSGATIASAQATGPGSAAPLPGTGDSTKISAGNRANNAEYNHLISSGDPTAANTNERSAKRHAAVPATAADLKTGSGLRDVKGVAIGTIAAVEADGAVVDTGQTKIKVPLVAFGKDDQGLLLGITAARFNELIAKAKESN
jgi:hypothetical protein